MKIPHLRGGARIQTRLMMKAAVLDAYVPGYDELPS